MNDKRELFDPKSEWSEVALDAAGVALDVAEVSIPYWKEAVGAFGTIRKHRVHRFLATLNTLERGFAEQDKGAIKKHIESGPGQELLSDFVQSATSARSERHSFVLAFAYAERARGKMTEEQARYICASLDGLDETDLDRFLLLCDRPNSGESDHEYPNYPYRVEILSKEVLSGDKELAAAFSEESLIGFVNNMIRRNLFLPDYTFDRGTPGHWTSIYGLDSRAVIIRDTLRDFDPKSETSSDK